MTQKERIINLTKLYCHYMTQFHKIVKEARDNGESISEDEYKSAVNEIEHLRNVYISPILDMLNDENVHAMKQEDGKTKVLMRDYTEIEVDTIIEFDEYNN